jgi:hypothetical protein
MKQIFIISLFALTFLTVYAQSPVDKKLNDDYKAFKQQARQEYEQFKEQSRKEYNDFRDRANAEYAEFMRQSWEEFQAIKGIPVPPSPDPVKPPVVDPLKPPTIDPLPFDEVIPVIKPVAPPLPPAPIPLPPQPVKPNFAFSFYNTECKVALDAGQTVHLHDLSEKSVSDAWMQLSDAKYNTVILDCLNLREKLNLCDWGYYQLIQILSDKYCGTTTNESVVFQMFILTQSGYKVRIAKVNDRLALLIPFTQTIYERSFLSIDGLNYYIIDKSLQGKSVYIFNHAFTKEQILSLQMRKQPDFSPAETAPKTFASVRYSNVRVDAAVNKNLIDFYNSYPVTSDWNMYAQASLSEIVKQQVYPVLKNSIAGKSEAEAANILINFVQTAFQYQTDQQQFGYERPLFGDETFYYPYSDCEDRSILYSILVRDLLGLEVVLLHYPKHLATAVRFTESVAGDYLTINGAKFIVCDPTYIGATIGMAMDNYKNVKAKVIKI